MKMENFRNRKSITDPHLRHGFADIFRRELGLSHSTGFARRFSASQVLVKNMSLYGKLHGHETTVHAVEFNSTGDLLVSGSEDAQVIFWNWASKTKSFDYPSGHSLSVFQTKIMPFTNDSRIVTSGLDGQVKNLCNCASNILYCNHKLAFEVLNGGYGQCGRCVLRPLQREFYFKIAPCVKKLKSSTCNSECCCSHRKPAAVEKVRLGLLHEDGGVVTTMLGQHRTGCVYKLAVEPGSPHTLYSCGIDGFVQHFDLRTNSPTELFCCYSRVTNKMYPPYKIELNSIVIDPRNPNNIAVGGFAEYARVYDRRKCRWADLAIRSDRPVHTFCPRHLFRSGHSHIITGMAYSNLSELLISYHDELIYLFENNAELGSSPSSATSNNDLNNLDAARIYAGHTNTCLINGVNFFGPNDEYVVSSSDPGYIFIWKKKEAKLVKSMVGDEYTVNQLEAYPHLPILATSGIENNVKIWAPLGSDIPPVIILSDDEDDSPEIPIIELSDDED